MKFLIPFPDISELGPVPPLGVAPWWTVQSKSSWVSWVKSHRDPWSKLQYTVAKRKKIVKTIRQCLYGISINVFTLIIAFGPSRTRGQNCLFMSKICQNLSSQWKTKCDRFVHQRTKFGRGRTNFKDAVDYLWSRPNWDKFWKTIARVF